MKDSENKFTLPLIGFCAVVMLVFALLWGKVIADLTHDTVFVTGCVISIAAFFTFSVIAEIKRDYPENLWKVLVLVSAAAFCIWCGAWKSDYNMKKSEGIEYKYNQSK